jgi:hypothetical protein
MQTKKSSPVSERGFPIQSKFLGRSPGTTTKNGLQCPLLVIKGDFQAPKPNPL